MTYILFQKKLRKRKYNAQWNELIYKIIAEQ